MKKFPLNDTDIDLLVKKSRSWFWFGIIVLSIPLIGCTYSLIDALMSSYFDTFYFVGSLIGLVPSFILMVLLLVKGNPGSVRKKYKNGYKIIEELSIKKTRSSRHGRMDPTEGNSVSNSAYSLYHMTLSNNKEYSIEYDDYTFIQLGKANSARLETVERNGKLISCTVIKSSSPEPYDDSMPAAFYRSRGH